MSEGRVKYSLWEETRKTTFMVKSHEMDSLGAVSATVGVTLLHIIKIISN